ncbi:MAG: lipoyl synthase [Elusimicrobiota bacterium]|jgi:lipoic acid synthetase
MNSERLPPWLKVRLGAGERFNHVQDLARAGGLNTVCSHARCPNAGECWSSGTATFMILGETCTRACRFCSVPAGARPPAPDPQEPERLAQSVAALGLRYAVLTTVCRDDLPDQGAGHAAACLRAVRARCPKTRIEYLAQDFRGEEAPLQTVLCAEPDVFAHNIETVERLTPLVRDRRAGYALSLQVLRTVRRLRPEMKLKSSIMLGLGETEEELFAAFKDLLAAGVSVLTLGQYLRPTRAPRHLPVSEFLPPARFAQLGRKAEAMGFEHAASAPLVRSSYRASEAFGAEDPSSQTPQPENPRRKRTSQ